MNSISDPFGKQMKIKNPFGIPQNQDNNNDMNNINNNNMQTLNTNFPNNKQNNQPAKFDKAPPKVSQLHKNQQITNDTTNDSNQTTYNSNINNNNINNTIGGNIKSPNTQYLNSSSKSNNDVMREEMIKKEFEVLSTYSSSNLIYRTSINKMPSNIETMKDSGIILGLNINPLNNTNPLPLIKYNEGEEIPRCNTCKAYINPFLKWVEGGDKWICNMCKGKNPTLPYYYEGFDKSGERKDKGTRPEISVGSYEFYATKSFISSDRPLNKPCYIFAIDVSIASSHTGYLSSVIEGIKTTIREGLPYEENTKVS